MLRNKIAEITRFVPTSLLVRRGASERGVGSSGGTNDLQNNIPSSTSSSNSYANDHHFNQYHQPYDYMSQQQQTYAHLNPLMTSSNSASSTNNNLNAQYRKSDGNSGVQQMPAKLASTDAAYESFMKEIGKLL